MCERECFCMCVSGVSVFGTGRKEKMIASAHQWPARPVSYLHHKDIEQNARKTETTKITITKTPEPRAGHSASVLRKKFPNRFVRLHSTMYYIFYHIESNLKFGANWRDSGAVRFGCLVDCTHAMPHHTLTAENEKERRYQHAAKFPRYIMLRKNFECTFAACPRLSDGDATNGKEKKGQFRVGPTENRKFECTRKIWESRTVEHSLVFHTDSHRNCNVRSFSYFLLLLACDRRHSIGHDFFCLFVFFLRSLVRLKN